MNIKYICFKHSYPARVTMESPLSKSSDFKHENSVFKNFHSGERFETAFRSPLLRKRLDGA